MPLSTAAQGLLDQMTAHAPDWKTISPLDFRAMSAAMVRPPEAADRVVTQDLDADGVPVRLFRRDDAEQSEPVLLFLHGGGYIACSVDSHARLCSRLARLAGCAVVSVEYRLAPEHVFPAAVEDADRALAWLAREAAGLGLDPARIAIGGDSAGGSLATVAARHALAQGGPALVAQLLIYPGTDLVLETESRRLFSDGYFLDSDFSKLCINAYVPEAADRTHPDVSPLRADSLAGLPPATILTAECDPLRDEGEAYADRLRAAGVPVDYRMYPGTFHGFASMFGILPEADAALADAAAALASAFQGSKPQ
ncbi:alpha/beta hydrolase [Sphingomonas jatrophae]|uniref:Acetyl esterase n=1 Tax=Sphingomonas jatrophae TaxID=1166337 RepID=A0A1I6KEF1_9SPHN|nr:alpha/beta hydrolase [Sphingomonas jatrophae]SFR89576.1 acetyl esterase [Sphingomonas jatrophae]